MMYFRVVLACALIAAVSAQTLTGTASLSASAGSTTTRRPFSLGLLNALNRLGGSVKSAIGLFNSTAHTATNLISTGVQGFSEAGQKMVSTASTMGSTALKGGVEAVKNGVDIRTNLVGMIPGMSGLASMRGDMVKAGADVVNMMGQTGISLGSGIANGKMQLASGLTSAGAGLATSGINMGVDMARSGVDTGIGMASGAIGTVGKVVDTAIDYVNQASGKVSSMASAAANRMTVSSGSLPSLNVKV